MATSRQLRRLKTSRQACSIFLLPLCLLLFVLPAVAQETDGHNDATTSAPAEKDFWNKQYLLGDWGGERTKLAEQYGVTFDFYYVADFLADPQGVQTGAGAWNRVRGTMDIDFGKLAHVKGLSLHATGVWQGGVNLGSQYLGSIANPSGLVSARTERLDSYWLQYDMLDSKVSFRFGQFAGMDFYGVQNYGGDYIMEPLDYAFGNLFNDYESYDPASGPAMQLQVNPARFLYFKAAYMSGNRDPYVQSATGFEYVKHDSGVFLDEIGFLFDQPGATKSPKQKYYTGLYKFGSTYNGGKFTDPFSGIPLYNSPYTGNYVIYFMANQAIYRPTPGSKRGLDVHFGFDGSPDQAYNKVDKTITTGVLFNAPFASRANDSVSFGLVYSHISSVYSAEYGESYLGAPVLGSEKAYEFNYLFQATPYFMVQPVVQLYQELGANPRNPTGVVLGFRTKVIF